MRRKDGEYILTDVPIFVDDYIEIYRHQASYNGNDGRRDGSGHAVRDSR